MRHFFTSRAVSVTVCNHASFYIQDTKHKIATRVRWLNKKTTKENCMIQEIALSTSGATGYVSLDMDDEENEIEGRILSNEEFIARLHEHGDIFSIDGEKRIITVEMISVFCAIMIGIGINRIDPLLIGSIPADSPEMFPSGTAKLLSKLVDVPDIIRRPLVVKPIPDGKKVLHSARKLQTESTVGTGVGETHARVARAGILGMLSSHVKGPVVQGDISSMSGIAKGIDAILAGTNSLKSSMGSGVNRRGQTGIGFETGIGSSGFNGNGPIGIDDLIGKEPNAVLDIRKGNPDRHSVIIDKMDAGRGEFIGGRSKIEILRVVMQNIQSLRYAYNKRLMDKPDLRGKIVCKFAIDEFGNVLACKLLESTIKYEYLEMTVNKLILRWKFEKINKPGDITEIVYPFVFSS